MRSTPLATSIVACTFPIRLCSPNRWRKNVPPFCFTWAKVGGPLFFSSRLLFFFSETIVHCVGLFFFSHQSRSRPTYCYAKRRWKCHFSFSFRVRLCPSGKKRKSKEKGEKKDKKTKTHASRFGLVCQTSLDLFFFLQLPQWRRRTRLSTPSSILFASRQSPTMRLLLHVRIRLPPCCISSCPTGTHWP